MQTAISRRTPFWRLPRWRYAAAAFLLGVLYTLGADLAGFAFMRGERDFTLAAGVLVELSFAGFGFLLGLVTEARRREQTAAGQAEQRLRELAGERVRLAQAEKLASLGELAGALSHELRNPLAILRAMVQNLEESLGAGATRTTCREMLEEIDRLAGVSTRLVDFARPLEPVRARVLPAELAERTRRLAEELLRDRPLRLELVPGPPGLVLDADGDLLCQVLLGLVENAAEVAPAGSMVVLGWAVAGDNVELRVEDGGPGVPAALRRKIFEPFFTTRAGGHGLGLAVARQIVEAHGGRIEVADRAGGGAVFRVLLPALAATSGLLEAA